MFDTWEMPEGGFSGVIPVGLDEIPPGPYLAAVLSSVDVGGLSGHDRVMVLRAHQRMASHYQARVHEDVASIYELFSELDDDAETAWESAEGEVRAALSLTRRATESLMGLAFDLLGRFRRVWEALDIGLVDVPRARTIISGVCHLPDETAQEVVDGIITDATLMTTGQIWARIRTLCVEADPQEAEKRHEEALAERRIVTQPTVDGTANLLGLNLAPHRVLAVTRRINRIAESLKTRDEYRSLDQLRADVFLDMLAGKPVHERKPTEGVVEIRVDLETLARLSDRPAELAGYGPVVADIARRVADQQQDSEWRYTVTDPKTRRPLHTGVTRRRPSTAQKRAVQARDRTCVFPGCRMPATACDLDHRIPWAEGGPTTVDHLAPLCRHDHTIRHHGWTLQPLADGGYQWTSRLNHTYITSGIPP